MASLTDRYVYAVTRRLSLDARDDVARELRATIEDTIDGRPEGLTVAEAERQALIRLGDPERLAVGYSGRPAFLIGPELYPHYVRVMRRLLMIVPPIAATVAILALVFGDPPASVGEVITSVGGAVVTATTQVLLWPTVGFAIAERHGADLGIAQRAWDPDCLDAEVPERQIPWSDLVSELLGHLVLLGILVIGVNPVLTGSDGSRFGLFGPVDPLWRWTVVVAVAGLIVVEVVKMARGRWTPAIAWWTLVLHGAVASIATWLILSGRLVSTRALDAVRQTLGWTWVSSTLTVTAVVIVGVSAWTIIKGFRLARRP